MDSAERGGRWRNLKGRLGFKGMGCCGATWGSRSSNMNVREEEEDDDDETMYMGQIPAGSGMNLATALAAERHLRAAGGGGGGGVGATTTEIAPDTPLRVSLMRLLEEADGGDGGREKERGEGSDGVCCVCMGRKKGAAFIPCGHTFCRVCTREVWLNRGSCPLCNRPILEILDIF